MDEATFDVAVYDNGSLCGLRPDSAAARDWFNANVQSESWQWMGAVLYVEPRYARHIIEGIQDDGMTVG